jgi:hypothetical protein
MTHHVHYALISAIPPANPFACTFPELVGISDNMCPECLLLARGGSTANVRSHWDQQTFQKVDELHCLTRKGQ